MTDELDGIALVTGAGRGIGRGVALELLRAGAHVIGTTHRHPEDADEVTRAAAEDSGRLAFLSADLSGPLDGLVDGVRETIARFGGTRLDWLVNNAGSAAYAPYAETSPEQFDRMFAVNVRAPYFLTQALLPVMTHGGRVLNVTAAITRGVVPGLSAYAATKGAVEVLTRYQARELAERGIAVNTVMFGATDTGLGDGMMRAPGVDETAARQVAWGRMAAPEDVARAVPAILSDPFAWSTGACFDVSGGQDI